MIWKTEHFGSIPCRNCFSKSLLMESSQCISQNHTLLKKPGHFDSAFSHMIWVSNRFAYWGSFDFSEQLLRNLLFHGNSKLPMQRAFLVFAHGFMNPIPNHTITFASTFALELVAFSWFYVFFVEFFLFLVSESVLFSSLFFEL